MRYLIYGQQGINDEVINHYLDIIKSAYGVVKKCNFVRIESVNDIADGDFVLLYTISDAFRVCLKKKIRYAIWMQGVYPEERQLRGKGKIDFALMSLIERQALSNAEKVFMVSKAMLTHYEKKYRLKLSHKTFIMPCYNCSINKDAFFVEQKYDHPSFVYAGSLANWQCFDKTLLLFKKINTIIPDAELYIYTKEKKKAEDVAKRLEIKNYHIGYVKSDDLNDAIKRCKYGFIIRDDITVNNVASPTKLSNYLSAGIIPVVSDAIVLYQEIANESDYFVVENNDESFVRSIINIEKKKIDPNSIYRDYNNLFDKYYNDNYYINAIEAFLV